MEKEFLSDMDFDHIKKYNQPFVITFTGLPGCGKTDIARTLSKELQIFLLSNDYIRNYYYQFTNDYSEEKRLEIEDKIKNINSLRLQKLIDNNISFIYDKCFNKIDDFEKLNECLKNKYKIIKIKINTTDSNNIKVIKNIKMDYDKIYEGVIGDNVEYLSSFPEEVYYEIKNRIPVLIKEEYVDYVINNPKEIDEVIHKIKDNIALNI